MSLRLDMLRAAARARRRRPDAAQRIARFLQSRAMPDGGFTGRGAASDLYYTVFGMQGLVALGEALPSAAVEPDAEPAIKPAIEPAAEAAGHARHATLHYLREFGDGASLDFVHLACLARCWALLADDKPAPDVRTTVLKRLEAFRSPDGGYHPTPGAGRGTAYAAFLALGAYQDFETPLPEPAGLVRCVQSLRTDGGGYANTPGMPQGSSPATAAAVVVLNELGETVGQDVIGWLAAQMHTDGGWSAMPAVPLADLLSTATAIHALAVAGASLDKARSPCLPFVESLWSDEGGFRGHGFDDHLDCEYTFYGLLALGHLAD